MDPRKKVKFDDQYYEDQQQFEQEEQDEEMEDNQFQQQEIFNELTLKEILIRIERNFNINSDLRSRYQNQPHKFIDSEIELEEDIQQLQILPSFPHLYPIFYNSEVVSIIIQLLLHQNQEIVSETLKFIDKLVSPEEDCEPKIIIQLYDCLIKNYLIESLNELITNNQETNQNESHILFDCFQIIENMVDIRKSMCKEFGQRTKIIQYLLKRIEDNSQNLDDIRTYASELLVILTQETEENQQIIGRSGGIENLLIVLSQYSQNDPETAEEKEVVQNVFDLLTLLLLKQENQDYFQQYEGLQLMFKLIKAKKNISFQAYQLVLLAINDNPKNCQQLIKCGGLAIIFPILDRKGLKNSDVNKQFKIDETSVLIIKQLLRRITDKTLKLRLIEKCKEKIESFIKLRKEYLDVIPLIDPEEYDSLKENQLEKIYIDLLGKGLIVIESIDVILLELKYQEIEIKEDLTEIISSVNQMLKYNNNEEDQLYYKTLLQKFENSAQ